MGIPLPGDGAAGAANYQRGTRVVGPFGAPMPQGPVTIMQFDRPPEPRPPGFVMLQCHTTGTKSRALGHESEKTCWALGVQNNLWCSARDNQLCRSSTASRAAGADDDLNTFYPAGLEYQSSQTSVPDPTVG